MAKKLCKKVGQKHCRRPKSWGRKKGRKKGFKGSKGARASGQVIQVQFSCKTTKKGKIIRKTCKPSSKASMQSHYTGPHFPAAAFGGLGKMGGRSMTGGRPHYSSGMSRGPLRRSPSALRSSALRPYSMGRPRGRFGRY